MKLTLLFLAQIFLLLISTEIRAQNFTRFRRYDGNIGNDPVSFFIAREGGTYYYKNVGQIIFLNSGNSQNEDSIFFHENFPGYTSSPSVKLKIISDSVLSGIWELGKRTAPIYLRISHDTGAYEFRLRYIQDSLALSINSNLSAQLRASIFYLEPIGLPIVKQEFIVSKIASFMGYKEFPKDGDLSTYAQGTVKNYLERTSIEVKSFVKDDSINGIAPDPENMFDFSEDKRIVVRYEGNDIVDIDCDIFSYTGGAHHNDDFTIHVLDLNDLKELKLKDIIEGNSIEIEQILISAIKKHKSREPETDFVPSDSNFYITSGGIGFHYSSMSVASWTDGPIEYFIPFSKLKGKLTSWIKRRMAIK